MGKKKRDTGKNFESEIRRSLKSSKHIWWFRIQDTNDVNRFIKQAVAEKQPADFFSVYRGRPIMVQLERKGGISLIMIRREEYRNKKCYAITPSQAKYLYSKAHGKKSIKWQWFDEHAYIVERLKAPLRWNIQELYEKVI
mgnify:CR=1 FL=1